MAATTLVRVADCVPTRFRDRRLRRPAGAGTGAVATERMRRRGAARVGDSAGGGRLRDWADSPARAREPPRAYFTVLRAASIVSHRREGERGRDTGFTPNSRSAAAIAFTITAPTTMVPPSPAPLAPIGLIGDG